MMSVVESTFERLAFDYLLTDEEAVRVAQEFASLDVPGTLMCMYASDDREAFAEDRLRPLVVEEVRRRGRIALPV